MASPRAPQLLLRTSRQTTSRAAQHASKALSNSLRSQFSSRISTQPITRAPRLPSTPTTTPTLLLQQTRSISEPSSTATPKSYTFTDILDIIEDPASPILLVDVREPHEFEANSIPTAINIPVTSQPDAMLLSEEDFEDRFGFEKPGKGKEMVMFCKAGVRSRAAAGLARGAG